MSYDDDGPITLYEVALRAGRAVERERALTEKWHSRSPDGWVSLGLEGTPLRAIEVYTTGKDSNLTLVTAPHGDELELTLDRGYWELDASVGTRVDSRSEDDAMAWVRITPVEPAVVLGAFVRGFLDDPIPDWIRPAPHRRSEFPGTIQVRLLIGPAPTP
ncbi:MAG: hypothetical protein M3Y87_07490 [Myxococcota bacterium]|nr:hypothetical protein [Myxococcota bacterium]